MCNNINLPKSPTSEETIKNIQPCVWWMSAERADVVHPLLCLISRKLLSMPASSASTEHIFFSNHIIQLCHL